MHHALRRGRALQRGALSRIPKHFHILDVKSKKSKSYWRKRIFGTVDRVETDIYNHAINIREWYAPNDWMNSLVSLAYEDSKRRGMGRFSQAMSEDKTNEMLYSLQERAHKNNLDIVVDGPKGISKSTVAVWFFLRLREAMWAVGKDLFGPEYTWSIAQCLAAYTTCKDWTYVIMDEDHHLTGKGSRTSEYHWGNQLKSIRIRQVSTVICSPEQEAMPGCETKITPIAMWREGYDLMKIAERAQRDAEALTGDAQVAAMEKAEKLFHEATPKCWCKVLVSSRDHSNTNSVAYKPTGYMMFNVGDALEFMHATGYEARKRADLVAMTAAMGRPGVYTDQEWIKAHEIEEKIIAAAHARTPPWDGAHQNFIETIAFDARIDLPTKTGKFITDFVWARRNEFIVTPATPASDSPKADYSTFSEFNPPYEEILKELAREDPVKYSPKNLAIWHAIALEKTKQDDLVKPNHFKTTSAISRIFRKVNGAVVDKRGHEYEKFIEQKKNDSKHFVEVCRDGGENAPDVWAFTAEGDAHVWSCKCYEFTREKIFINVPVEMAEEIKIARELAQTHAHVFLYLQKLNLADGKEEEIPINYTSPPESYMLTYTPPT